LDDRLALDPAASNTESSRDTEKAVYFFPFLDRGAEKPDPE
jgi:hypothetical protein